MTENTPSLVEVIERALQHCGVEMTDSRTSVVAKRIERALLAANLVGEGWQTMDDAAKDGEPILAASTNHDVMEVVCWFAGEPGAEYPGDKEGWVDTGPQRERFYANPLWFTHYKRVAGPPRTTP